MYKLLKRAVETQREKTFVVYEERAYSFLEIYDKVINMAKKLVKVEEKRVAVISKNSLDFLTLLLAAPIAKKELLLINTRLTSSEVSYQLENIGVECAIIEEEFENKIPQGIKRQCFQEVQALKGSEFELSENSCEDIFYIMYTSGTTGKPKAVPHRKKNLFSSAESSAEILGVDMQDNWLLYLPLFHVSGLMILMRSLANHTALTLYKGYEEEKILEVIEKKRVNIASFVPMTLAEVIDRVDLKNFRVILLGGAKPSDKLLEKAKRLDLPIFQTYGMTETTSQISTLTKEYIYTKVGSVGKVIPRNLLELRNVQSDGVGEIFVKGGSVIDAYIHGDAIEWLATGDMGRFDSEGFLYIVTRRTDLIVSGGENIYPSEIENSVVQIEGVKEACVVKRASEKWGEISILYIVGNVSKERVLKTLEEKLARYKHPREIIFVKSLPKNSLGKIMRHKLLEAEAILTTNKSK